LGFGTLWRPATGSSGSSNGLIEITIDPAALAPIHALGTGGNSIQPNGTIVAGRILLQTQALILSTSPGTVQHEMLHVFGIGHTCSWNTVISDCIDESVQRETTTVTDVAYIQLLYRVGGDIAFSHQGERIMENGQPREAFRVNGKQYP
jgi:hypothetical protein